VARTSIPSKERNNTHTHTHHSGNRTGEIWKKNILKGSALRGAAGQPRGKPKETAKPLAQPQSKEHEDRIAKLKQRQKLERPEGQRRGN
jgi:hypothetical protein